MRNTYPELQEAVRELSRRCDGAVSEDGVGFNGRDTNFGHSLAQQDRWTIKQARAAHKMLNTYRKQLGNYGIDYTAIPFPEEKLVLFATHYETVDEIMEKFPGAVKVDGRDSAEDKQAAVDAFQTDPECNLFVGTIKAAGVGLTLTESSNVGFLEFDWNPALHDQAEDRTHRMGQENSVNCYYLAAKDTIDEKIMGVLDRKRRIVDAVTDGRATANEDMLGGVLKELREEAEA